MDKKALLIPILLLCYFAAGECCAIAPLAPVTTPPTTTPTFYTTVIYEIRQGTSDYSYRLQAQYDSMSGLKNGAKVRVITDPTVDCPEMVRMYIFRSPAYGHVYTSSTSFKNTLVSQGWAADEGSSYYYCVPNMGDCGADLEWNVFNKASSGRYYGQSTGPAGYAQGSTDCYVWSV